MITPSELFNFLPEKSSDKQFLSWNEDVCEKQYSWQVPLSLPYFDGHFPGQPLLPAFAIVDANMHLLKDLLPKGYRLQKVKSAKFLGPIEPGAKLSIQVKCSTAAEKSIEICWKALGQEKALTQFNFIVVYDEESENASA